MSSVLQNGSTNGGETIQEKSIYSCRESKKIMRTNEKKLTLVVLEVCISSNECLCEKQGKWLRKVGKK